MKIPLVIREIESRTDDLEEKAIITRIHEMKHAQVKKWSTCKEQSTPLRFSALVPQTQC